MIVTELNIHANFVQHRRYNAIRRSGFTCSDLFLALCVVVVVAFDLRILCARDLN